MTIHIDIDVNIRVRGNQTYVGFEDADILPEVGDSVIVRGMETDLRGRGLVEDIDHDKRLIYLSVDWASLLPAPFLNLWIRSVDWPGSDEQPHLKTDDDNFALAR